MSLCVSEKLYNSQGPELRRSLFSLKQLFQVRRGLCVWNTDRSRWCVTGEQSLFLQDDKDLVPEFVASEGLTCFIKVGAEADHNYQNYILRGKACPALQLDTPLMLNNVSLHHFRGVEVLLYLCLLSRCDWSASCRELQTVLKTFYCGV